MSDFKNTPSGGTGSRGSQNDLVTLPSSNLQVPYWRNGSHKSGASQQGNTARFVLHALRQWWKVATPIAVVLAVISVTVVYALFEDGSDMVIATGNNP